MDKGRQVDRPIILSLISWTELKPSLNGPSRILAIVLSIEKVNRWREYCRHWGRFGVFFNHEYPSWTHLAFHLFTKVINWSKSTRMDFSTGTSFSKFSPIFMYLERVTHTKKATFGVKKINFQFFYMSLSWKDSSQNSLQNKDSGETIKCRSNRRRKAKGKKRAVNVPKKLLN